MVNRMILNETSYFGAGARKSIVDEVKKRDFKKALLVTDKDLMKFGVTTKVIDVLEKAGLCYEVYDEIKQNPTVKNVTDGVEAFKKAGADYIISVGGGSAIDTAKGIGIIINNPEFADVVSLEGVADTKNKSVPHIAVATTAGTAAEVTINYVITDVENKRKFVCVDPADIPIIAIVDPELMASMPKGLAAATGMDALTHAIEGYITKGAWELTDTLTLKSIEMIAKNLKAAVEGDMDAKANMGVAQYVAGMAFSNVGLGIVHSMAHPLGAFYDTPHGVANALLLPYVMEYNSEATGDKYMHIAKAFGVENAERMSEDAYRTAAVEAVRKLACSIGVPQKLSEIGVKEDDLKALSEAAYKDVCTGGNPKETSVEEILQIYKRAY
ncbi:MAG: lactaldehyde reductase [Clostridia bacterium]|nr:lactaldehyde reductase [Clostridia bacterium]